MFESLRYSLAEALRDWADRLHAPAPADELMELGDAFADQAGFLAMAGAVLTPAERQRHAEAMYALFDRWCAGMAARDAHRAAPSPRPAAVPSAPTPAGAPVARGSACRAPEVQYVTRVSLDPPPFSDVAELDRQLGRVSLRELHSRVPVPQIPGPFGAAVRAFRRLRARRSGASR